ncbi:uncharacterized protein LOC131229826 [Magnolia sinica]|uniref:uncharacterized protein LOC131229826 n=1 Tax=Magnolia sinica TaxID=86752 RepID=UPI00265A6BC7|nr:uncharacterized protein LOC131229826 [Magnolia sinica]
MEEAEALSINKDFVNVIVSNFNASSKGFFKSGGGLTQGDPPFAFLVCCCSRSIGRMLSRGINVGHSNVRKVDKGDFQVICLQFADDTLFLCDPHPSQAENLLIAVAWFDVVSRLSVDLHKSEVLDIGLDFKELGLLALTYGCREGSFPTTCLGLPLCIGKVKRQLWEPVTD